MSTNFKNSLAEVESQMAELKDRIEKVNAKCAPIQSELDSLNAQAISFQERAKAKAEELQKARPGDWFEMKKQYGKLASLRMTLRDMLKK